MKKILTKEELIANLAKSNDLKQTILCHGVWDVLHIGHIRHLHAAKEFGDILIVSITSDKYVNKGVNRPVFNEKLRAEVLSSLDCVDYVYINDEATPINLISILKPNYYVKGNEYTDLDNDITGNIVLEKEAIEKVNGKLKFTNEIEFSSSNIINKHSDIFSPEARRFIKTFKQKNDFNDIINYFDAIRNSRILVIGEAIIDEYVFGHSLGKSGKAPIVALGLEKIERYIGGSLIIANHLSEFVNIDLISLIGFEDNISKDFILSKLSSKINPLLFSSIDTPTITKRRYIENNQKLFETYLMNDKPIDLKLENQIIQKLESSINEYDMVLICDFGHGLLTKKICDFLKRNSKFVTVNTQLNAGNMGRNTIRKYWDRTKNTYISIDETELRLAMSDEYDKSHSIKDILKDKLLSIDKIAITRESSGCIIKTKNNSEIEIPAFANKIVDTTGAGDAFFALSSLCAMGKTPSEWIGFVGNIAGALATSYVGNKEYMNKLKIYKFMETLMK